MAEFNQPTPHLFDSGDKNVVIPVILVFVGLVLLGFNLGYYPSQAIYQLLSWWPILLILLGLQVLFGHRPLGRLLVFIVAVISFTLITRATLYTSSNPLFSMPQNPLDLTGFSPPPPLPGNPDLNESDQTSTTKKVTFNFTAAKVNVTDQNQPQHLLLPEQKSLFIKPEINVSQKQSQALITATVNGNTSIFSKTATHQMVLGRTSLPTDLILNLTASQTEINLSSTKLTSGRIRLNAGKLDLFISEDAIPKEPLILTINAGSVTLKVPESVGVKVKYHTTVGKIVINGISQPGSDEYTTVNYHTARHKLDLLADITAASLIIDNDQAL
jgi:hypothetical protein